MVLFAVPDDKSSETASSDSRKLLFRTAFHKTNWKKKKQKKVVGPTSQHICEEIWTISAYISHYEDYEDPEEFYKYARLYPEEFELLVSLVRKRLTKRSNINTITVEERVAITLR